MTEVSSGGRDDSSRVISGTAAGPPGHSLLPRLGKPPDTIDAIRLGSVLRQPQPLASEELRVTFRTPTRRLSLSARPRRTASFIASPFSAFVLFVLGFAARGSSGNGEVPRDDVAAALAELVQRPDVTRLILELTSGPDPIADISHTVRSSPSPVCDPHARRSLSAVRCGVRTKRRCEPARTGSQIDRNRQTRAVAAKVHPIGFLCVIEHRISRILTDHSSE